MMLSSDVGNRVEKPGKKTPRSVKVLPQISSSKPLGDEEIARRLHEELNGPEGSSPVTAATRRSRKAPTFYSPAGPSTSQALDGSGPDDSELAEAGVKGQLTSPGDLLEQKAATSERPGSTGSKKSGRKSSGPAEEQPGSHAQAGSKARPKSSETASQGSRPPTRSCFAEEAGQALAERRPSLRGSKNLKEVKSEDLAALRPALGSRGPADSNLGIASSMASSSHASDQEQEAGDGKTATKRLSPKVPRMPMCRHGQLWYRARKVQENNLKVLLEFPGVSSLQPVWLTRDSPRIWTGSYKGKDWKHLGDGAWEPKLKEETLTRKQSSASRGRKRRRAGSSATDDEASEEEVERTQKNEGTPASERRAASVSAQKEDDKPFQPRNEEQNGASPVKAELQDAELGCSQQPVLEQPRRRGRPPGKRTKKDTAKLNASDEEACRSPSAAPNGAVEAVSNAAGHSEGGGGDSEPAQEADTPKDMLVDSAEHLSRDRQETSGQAEAPHPSRRLPATGTEHGYDGIKAAADLVPCPLDTAEEHCGAKQANGVLDYEEDEAAAALLAVRADPQPDTCEELSSAREGGREGRSSVEEDVGEEQESGKADARDQPQQNGQSAASKRPGTGLGALAQALANANATKKPAQSPQPSTPVPGGARTEAPGSAKAPASSRSLARKRKKANVVAALPCKLPAPDATSCGDSGSGNSNPCSFEARVSNESPSTSNEDSQKRPGEDWRMAFKEKHRRRLEEVEAEEEAAESQELVLEGEVPQPAQKSLGGATKRPERSLRVLRAPTQEAAEALAPRDSKETEAGSPLPTRRGSRGRGRWANHIKRGGGRAARPVPSSPAGQQEPPAVPGRGGRGRRGGRAPPAPKTESGRLDRQLLQADVRIAAFGMIVDALERKAEGLAFPGFPSPAQDPAAFGLHPCHKILETPAERFLPYQEACEEKDRTWSFSTQLPPVPLFK